MILNSDSIVGKASPSARRLGGRILGGATLPNDQVIVDVVDPVEACTELMASLVVAGPWAVSVSARVPGLQAEARRQEIRAVKAEADLKTAQDQVQVVSGQAEAISLERDQLKEDLKKTQDRLKRRNDQLKAARKALKKEKKRLELSEERFFTTTYEMMVRRAAEVGLDHKFILLEGLEDPVGKESAPEEPLVVPSESEEELSY